MNSGEFVLYSGLIFFLVLLTITVITLYYGAPYVASTNEIIKRMLKLAGDVKNKKVVDLGSGDGKILTAFTKAKAEVDGFEINPFLYTISKVRVNMLGGKPRARVYLKNYWNVNLSKYDIILIYGMPNVMEKLFKKLRREIDRNKKITVISSTFIFKNIKPKKKIKNVYLYEIYSS